MGAGSVSDILLRNAVILTMDDKFTRIDRGALWVRDGRIAWLGPEEALPGGERPQKVVDCRGGVVMPGLVNAHTHLAMTLMRGLGSDLPLQEWLFERIFPVESVLTADDCEWGSRLGIAEMLLSGTTCFADMYFYMDRIARVVEETGIRACLSRGLMDGPQHEEKLGENIALHARWHGGAGGRITVRLGPHAEYTNTRASMARFAKAARELGCGLMVHVSETEREVAECAARHGMSPVAFLDDAGIFSAPCMAAHCVAVDQDDMDILARRGVAVVHNPTSNLKLASGVAPVTAMLERGIPVALGTDGCASNNNLDMWEEMHIAALAAKGFTKDPTALSSRTVLYMATRGGARALGLEQEIGSLEPGKKADLIVVDTTATVFHPLRELENHLVYAAGRGDVRLTMVDGRVLARDGKLTAGDLADTVARFEEHARKLYERTEVNR
jgi:5-methylthioadenosine/S-adenosylhomocysteine deaminase